MSIEGIWWYLVEEEPFHEDRTAQWRLADGIVIDVRTGARIGSYELEKGRLEIAPDGKTYTIESQISQATPTLITAVERHPSLLNDNDGEGSGGEMVLAALLTRAEAVVVPLERVDTA